MALCHCDGPPHTFDPSWCVNGLKPAGDLPMRPTTPWGRDTLRPPHGSPRARREDAIRRLDDKTASAVHALEVLGVTADEIDHARRFW